TAASIGTYTKPYDKAAVATEDLELTATANGEDISGEWAFVGAAPINAGAYACVLEFTPDEGAAYESVRTTVNVTIDPVTVTVTARNMVLKVDDELPTVPTAADYMIEGLLEGDVLDPLPTAFLFSISDTGAAADNESVALIGDEFTADGNYRIEYVAGILTVTAADPETVATPVATPNGGTFTDSRTVTLFCATPGATIYYTTNGTVPTASSSEYTGPITLTDTTVLKAIAVKSGMMDSDVLTVTFTKNAPAGLAVVATPIATPDGGTFAYSQQVILSCAEDGSVIYYTTDGSVPTAASAQYTGPITIYESVIIRAIAVKSGMEDSDVLTVAFVRDDLIVGPVFPVGPSTPVRPDTSANPGKPENPNPPTPEDPKPETPGISQIPPVPTFTDVPSGAWYQQAVEFVVQNGLMRGTSDRSFSPDSNLTRAQLAQILYNKEGNPAVAGSSTFADVRDGVWYTPAIVWAAAKGVVGGYGDGLFGPDNNITREQLAVMLWRYAGSPTVDGGTLNFSDAGKTSSWAVEALKWAVANGVLSGKGDGILDPTGLATRAEAAQMLKTFMANQ
ncbi:MAG: chitobiase/beta-hexosaminidase C-terminal domain-containing protein, partial [Oscillospiraceae bacterium]|nr:chitobiase/beta-hexosaminidase C-terminal domain-containing protein [Oscillospiraceae bacterium]